MKDIKNELTQIMVEQEKNRQKGYTTEMIKLMAVRKDSVVLCHNTNMCNQMFEISRDMGYNIDRSRFISSIEQMRGRKGLILYDNCYIYSLSKQCLDEIKSLEKLVEEKTEEASITRDNIQYYIKEVKTLRDKNERIAAKLYEANKELEICKETIDDFENDISNGTLYEDSKSVAHDIWMTSLVKSGDKYSTRHKFNDKVNEAVENGLFSVQIYGDIFQLTTIKHIAIAMGMDYAIHEEDDGTYIIVSWSKPR